MTLHHESCPEKTLCCTRVVFFGIVIMVTAMVVIFQSQSPVLFPPTVKQFLHSTKQKTLQLLQTVDNSLFHNMYKPCQLLFNTSQSTYPFNSSFKDLLPRSAYFDDRHNGWRTEGVIVVLIQISKTALKEHRVVGCGVDEYCTDKFKLQALSVMAWVNSEFPYLTHNEAMLTCYNLPVYNGSRVFVLYKDKSGRILKVETERKLVMPSKKVSSKGGWKSSILVCTTLYGKPTWLREWLVYQKTIGVDFIHIYAQESFITEGGVNNSVLRDYLESGYATLDVWKSYLNTTQEYYYQQPRLIEDCIYRYRTAFDYILVYDTDDFFIPVIPGKTDVHYYAERVFRDKRVSVACFQWRRFYPNHGLTQDPETIKDGNVTKYLVNKKRDGSINFKSMYRLSEVVEIGVHIPAQLLHGRRKDINSDVAYVGHLRMRTDLPKWNRVY